jgi:hypothetical protein
MTKKAIFECDRCKAEIRVDSGEVPEGIVINAFRESRRIDLCDDCSSIVSYMMRYVKEFDSLADALAKKECGES